MDEKIGNLKISIELINKVQKEAAAVSTSIKNLKASVERDLGGVTQAARGASSEMEKMGAKADGVEAGSKKLEKAAAQTSEAIGGVSKETQMMAFQLFIIGMTMAQLAKQLAALRDSMINFAKSAVTAANGFSETMQDLGMSMGLADDQVKSMGQKLTDLSLIIPLSTDKIGKLAIAIADAGIQGEASVLAMTAAIARLSVVFENVPVEKLTSGVLSMVKNFGLSIGEIDNMASSLILLNQRVGGTFDQYVTSLNTVAGSNRNLNFEFNEMATLLGALVPSYDSVSSAATGLDGIMKGLSENTASVANTLGVSTAELAKMLEEDAANTIVAYVEKLSTVESQSEMNTKAFTDFGKEGGRAIMNLTTNVEQLKEIQALVNDEFKNGNTFQQEYAKNAKDLNSSWTTLKNTTDVLMKQIGNEILPYVIKFLQGVIKVAQVMIAIWRSLSPEAKRIIIIIGALTLAAVAVLTVFSAMLAIILPLIVGFFALAAVTTGVGAAFAILAVILGIAIVAVVALIAAFGGLSQIGTDEGFASRISKWLGLDGLSEEIERVKNDVNSGLEDMASSGEENLGKLGSAITDMSSLLHEWSNTFLNDYVYQFTKADWALLDSVTDIAQQHFDILERSGTLSAEQALLGIQRVRGYLGQAISDMKDFGKISAETLALIRNAVGPDRAESILKEIQQGIKVNELEDVIKTLGDQLGSLKQALKDEIDLIDEQIKGVEGMYDDQIKPLEDSNASLIRTKKALEKQYKIEIRTYEERVDAAKDALDLEKDTFDEIKAANDAEMEINQEERDAARERLDDALATVRELKALRDKEVAASEGMLDFARMNLEAAQNNLKRQKIMGKDEFDANYRAAIDKVQSAEDQVDLANDTYIRTKRASDEEIQVAEDKVDIQRTALEAIEDNIKALQKIHKIEEDYYKQRVDIIQDELDTARDALDDFKDLYNEQKDNLQDQIDAQQDAMDEINDLRKTELEALKAERDAVTGRYDEEIKVIDEKTRAAEEALEKEKDYLYTLQRLNDEYIKAINDRMSAIETDTNKMKGDAGLYIPLTPDMDYSDGGRIGEGTPKNPDGIGSKMPDFSAIAENIKQQLITDLANIPTPVEFGEQVGKWFMESVKNNPETWKKILGVIIGLIFPPVAIINFIKEVDWGKVWEDTKTFLTETLPSVNWSEVTTKLLNIMFPGPQFIIGFIKGALGIGSDSEWSWGKDVKDPLVEKVRNITWGDVVSVIKDAMGTKVPGFVSTALGWGGEVAANIKTGITNGKTNIGIAAYNLGTTIKEKMDPWVTKAKDWGGDIVENLKTGLERNQYKISNAVSAIGSALKWGSGVIRGLWDLGIDALDWGKHLVENMAEGITRNISKVTEATTKVVNKIKDLIGFSVPKDGPLHDMMEWMPHMMQNLAGGIKSNIPLVASEIDKIAGVIAGGIGSPLLSGVDVGGLDGVIGGVASPSNATVNQVEEHYHIHAGQVFATEGEMRQFARQIDGYRKSEAQRSSSNSN